MARPLVIGITGGIGSGKTTVAAMLARLGAQVLDADALGHEALERPDVRRALRRAWGGDVFDDRGRVDREALAEAAFASDEQTRRLNAIVHPPLLAQLRQRLRQCCCAAVAIDAALLTEWGLDELCSTIVFVDAPEAVRLERIAHRGWSSGELRRREARQQALEEKRRRSQCVISNGGRQSETFEQVVRFWRENVKPKLRQEKEEEQEDGQSQQG